MDITKWDRNFCSGPQPPEDAVFYDSRQEPFQGYGLYDYRRTQPFRRMPQSVADTISPGVGQLCRHTAGGRVRFRTDSPYLVIRAVLADCAWMGHMSFLGAGGFSVYTRQEGAWKFCKSIVPSAESDAEKRCFLQGLVHFPTAEIREIMVYFPLYSGVVDLWIGLQDGSALSEGLPYRYKTPVLFYGSSITQGGCASRPGNSYEGFLSRGLDCDYLNLGFSGSGKAEEAMGEYLAELPASVFVMAYDHNAPDTGYLAQTHERLYRLYRAKKETVPIILVSRPDFGSDPSDAERRDIIRQTYHHALQEGDLHVYFLDGEDLFASPDGTACDCTVDGSHPNDLGFYRMAKKIGAQIKSCLREV